MILYILSDVAGRIDYISNPKRQEHLYATYQTEGATPEFWKNLARENQLDFKTSGTAGKCIEGREFIIALPESFVEYKADDVVRLFTDSFHKRYGVECSAALHHNKRMTNYHIHLVFSERKMLEHPEVKIATRNMFYDEQGKHRRTKKEILDEQGNLRVGCSIIPKGEVYESHIFTKKDECTSLKAEHCPLHVYIYQDLLDRMHLICQEVLQVLRCHMKYQASGLFHLNSSLACMLRFSLQFLI